MTTLEYTLTDSDGDRILVYSAGNFDAELHIEDNTETHRTNYAYIAKEQAPALALAILEAAGYGPRKDGEAFAPIFTVVNALKDHISQEAFNKENEQLDREAKALHDAGREVFSDGIPWDGCNENSRKVFRAIAKKARELHKGEAK